jgi:hypothetical protein
MPSHLIIMDKVVLLGVKGNMVCPANSSYSFRATALIFCRMFIHIMEVYMSTGFWGLIIFSYHCLYGIILI